MGIFGRPSGSSSEPSGRIALRASGGTAIAPGEPKPTNYKLVGYKAFGPCAVVEIVYPDCKNFEGRKILVYDDHVKFDALLKKGSIDPHFFEHTYSPVARFEPTARGRELACTLAKVLANEIPNHRP